MKKVHIFTDFDGTITEKDTLVFLATNLGGGPQLVQTMGRLIREGRVTLRDGIAGEMRSIRVPFETAERALREQVRIDPGFPPFASWCRERLIPLTILSAGFHQIIDLFIDGGEYRDGGDWSFDILANEIRPDTENGWQAIFRDSTPHGHDKAEALHAARKRGEYIIFIGDGLSDRPAAEAADEVFAKHTLAEFCFERGIECHEYRNFTDILDQLRPRF